MNTARVSYSQ